MKLGSKTYSVIKLLYSFIGRKFKFYKGGKNNGFIYLFVILAYIIGYLTAPYIFAYLHIGNCR